MSTLIAKGTAMSDMTADFCQFVRQKFRSQEFIPLHAPVFSGNEELYVQQTIQSTFVSTVGQKVVEFEKGMAEYLGVKHAIAMVNGTAALHIALVTAGVAPDTEVLTQPLSFVATANAIHYTGAHPVFLDVSESTMSLCPDHLADWLETHAKVVNGNAINKSTGRIISACVPMHTFGFIGRISEIIRVCQRYGIPVIEDAAESLGSTLNGVHAGNFGISAALSFNGNKIITTGGGGMLVTNDDGIAEAARHLSTTAKQPHAWEYVHDAVGYNYRMPNLNAALGVAQLEQLPSFLQAKRELADTYARFFDGSEIEFEKGPADCQANYWLCTIKLPDRSSRDAFLKQTNESGIMTRPVWQLLNKLPPYRHCQASQLSIAEKLSDRLINIPSSVIA